MAEILEAIMLISFGVSWPFNLLKSFKARTAKGKSPVFLLLIIFGYVSGIIAKLVNDSYMAQIRQKWYVLFFYVLNLVMVSADFCMYIKNSRLDRMRIENKEKS